MKFLFSKYDTIQGHKRRYSESDLNKLISIHNLVGQKVCSWGGLMIPFLIIRKYLVSTLADQDVMKKGFTAHRLVENFLDLFCRMEYSLFFKLPIGSSCLAFAKKPADEKQC